jgi:hypothetical protein
VGKLRNTLWNEMLRTRLRFWLPVCHTLIDLLFLMVLFYWRYEDVSAAIPQPPRPAIWWQHYDYGPNEISIDKGISAPLGAISSGTLPVSIISSLAFANWWWSEPFDLRWVGMHLALGLGFWYAIGWFDETSKFWRLTQLGYVLLRLVTVPVSLTSPRGDGADILYMFLAALSLCIGLRLLWASAVFCIRRMKSAPGETVKRTSAN